MRFPNLSLLEDFPPKIKRKEDGNIDVCGDISEIVRMALKRSRSVHDVKKVETSKSQNTVRPLIRMKNAVQAMPQYER